jgi:hypothetical protein
MRFSVVAVALVAGCAGEADAPPCGGGPVRAGVITELRFERPVDGVSDGFDLDGTTSTEDGATGCGIADYTDPTGLAGVDNAMSRLLPALDLTEAANLEEIVVEIINSGELMLLWELSNYDDPYNDECVDFALYRGTGAPDVGTDGFIAPSQTFDVDPEVGVTTATELAIEDGVIEATGLTMPFALEVFDARLSTELTNTSVRFTLNDDGTFDGHVAGALDFWAVVEMVNNAAVDQALASSLPVLFGANADLSPDSTGTCQKISVTFTARGEPAYLYEDVDRGW